MGSDALSLRALYGGVMYSHDTDGAEAESPRGT